MASGVGLLLTSIYTGRVPAYTIQELEVLFILFALFITINGLQHSGIISKLSRSIQQGKSIPARLVIVTFFLSMLVTNDVALIVMVPLSLQLNNRHNDLLVILEVLAANAGSALTPLGNPQNLYIYWFYDLRPSEFIETIAPFSLTFLVILTAATLLIRAPQKLPKSKKSNDGVAATAYIYVFFLCVILLTVLHLLPVSAGMGVVAFALLFDRKSLHIDYSLLLTFIFFFGLSENIRAMLAPEISHPGHIFLFSALASQIMSNVPATLLFAKFTTNWKALLWGTNTGGFGSLFGSFANLIGYRIYIKHENTENSAAFTMKFIIIGYTAFLLSMGLYFLFHKFQ